MAQLVECHAGKMKVKVLSSLVTFFSFQPFPKGGGKGGKKAEKGGGGGGGGGENKKKERNTKKCLTAGSNLWLLVL